MARNYSVGLEYELREGDLVTFEDTKNYIITSGLFDKEKSYGEHTAFIIKTTDDRWAHFTPDDFYLGFSGNLEEQPISDSIKSTIEMAKKLKKFRFDPDFIGLSLGSFDGKARFIKDFGPIAEILQTRIYLGGDVQYTEDSNDFQVFLSAKQEIFKHKDGKIEKLSLRGTSKPVSSLDELLSRLEQF
ncbi:hypothetical protein HYW20_05355 [Candidatus Woesearchaeota archaeon]|nr:hypothetical protein [Candidatus Woesearchaeota archaeon]